MKSIEVTVFPDGKTEVETKGFSGTDCRAASASIEEALGKVTRDERTSESYRPSVAIGQHIKGRN